jgi:rhodanese-related sulfurtransferase
MQKASMRLLGCYLALQLMVITGCDNRSEAYINTVPIDQLAQEIKEGKKIVFLDTREPEEFAETRIPNAINVPLRHVNAELVASLRDADRVIPYCLKDFRGFEAAKMLKRHGLNNVVLMYPHGLKGWQSRWAQSAQIVKPS